MPVEYEHHTQQEGQLTTPAEIRAKAAALRADADRVHEGALALERQGAPARLISDVRKRRDEYEDQADNMDAHARELESA